MNIAIREKMHPTLGVMVRDNGEILVPEAGVHKAHWTNGYWSQRYYRVQINGTKYFVHRLVAETFIDNPDNLPFVDHIDHDRRNCAVSNLRWTDYTGNNRNSVRCESSFDKYGVHKYEDIKAYRKAHAAEYSATHKQVVFNDSHIHWVSLDTANSLLKLPVKERIYKN